MMIKATTTTLWHLLRPTQKYIGTLSSSHTTHAHQLSTPQPDAPACAASRNPNTTTSQTQTRATTGKQQTVKESPPQPPTQPTTGYKSFQLPGGCLGDDKNTTHPTHTPQTPSTHPQNTPTNTPDGHGSSQKNTEHSPSETTVENKTTSPRVQAVS